MTDFFLKGAEQLNQETLNNLEQKQPTLKRSKIKSIEIEPRIERRLFQRKNMRSPDQKLLKPVIKLSEMKQNLGHSHGPFSSNRGSSTFQKEQINKIFINVKMPKLKRRKDLKKEYSKVRRSVHKMLKRNQKMTKLNVGFRRNQKKDDYFKNFERRKRSSNSKSPVISKTSVIKDVHRTPKIKRKKPPVKKSDSKNVNIYSKKFNVGNKLTGNLTERLSTDFKGYDSLKKQSDSIFQQQKKYFETSTNVESNQMTEPKIMKKFRKMGDLERKNLKFAPKTNLKKMLLDVRNPFLNRNLQSPKLKTKKKTRNLKFNKLVNSNREFDTSLRSPDPKRSTFLRSKTRDLVKGSKYKVQGVGSYQKMPKLSSKAQVYEKGRKSINIQSGKKSR